MLSRGKIRLDAVYARQMTFQPEESFCFQKLFQIQKRFFQNEIFERRDALRWRLWQQFFNPAFIIASRAGIILMMRTKRTN
jgi:hypothetical protein